MNRATTDDPRAQLKLNFNSPPPRTKKTQRTPKSLPFRACLLVLLAHRQKHLQSHHDQSSRLTVLPNPQCNRIQTEYNHCKRFRLLPMILVGLILTQLSTSRYLFQNHERVLDLLLSAITTAGSTRKLLTVSYSAESSKKINELS
jgi:hypothetical protein